MVKQINMNNILLFQIILSTFVIYFIWRMFSKKNKGVLKISELVGWLIVWLIVLSGLWWPGLLSLVAFKLGVGRGVDLAIYVALILQMFLIFRLFVKADRQQQEITIITRKIAIQDANQKNNESK